MFNSVKALIRGKKMAKETKEKVVVTEEAKPKKKRKYTRRAKAGVGRPKGSGKRGRPKGSKNKPKRKPGRPQGSGKGKVGRPKGKKRGPKPGRKAVVVPKGFMKKAEAKRLVKKAVDRLKARIPAIVKRELKKMLR